MIQAKDYFETGLALHGHKCPAMPLGLRAAAAAMNALGVERSQDKELVLLAETGNDHAAGCFVDGLMTVTGCTYGKSNIKKAYYGKMAFTLIDTRRNKAVRVQLKPEFFGKMLNSPFVQQRKQGVLPQDIPAEITDPLVAGVMVRAEAEFLDIGPVFDYAFTRTKGTFDTDLCQVCGERVFVNKLEDVDGKRVCVPCREKLSGLAEPHRASGDTMTLAIAAAATFVLTAIMAMAGVGRRSFWCRSSSRSASRSTRRWRPRCC